MALNMAWCSMHEHITGWETNPSNLYALNSSSWNLECCKSALLIAMLMLCRKYEALVHDVVLLQDPCMAMAKKVIAKGALIFVACSTKVVSASSMKKGAKPPNQSVESHVMDHAGNTWCFHVAPHTALPDDDVKKDTEKKAATGADSKGTEEKEAADAGSKAAEDKTFICPFWFTQKGTDSNMTIGMEVVELGSFSVHVPIMTNSKKLLKGDALIWSEGNKRPAPEAVAKAKAKAAKTK